MESNLQISVECEGDRFCLGINEVKVGRLKTEVTEGITQYVI